MQSRKNNSEKLQTPGTQETGRIISWWLVLLVEETGVPGENKRFAASH
jgi:hypothetical protein